MTDTELLAALHRLHVGIMVSATITGNGADLDADGYDVAASFSYVGTLHLAEGNIPNAPIGRPIFEVWTPPLLVKPLANGTRIHGLRVLNTYTWLYVEQPKKSPCSPEGAGA